MENLTYPGWQELYYDALVELDLAKLPKLVVVAHGAIVQRLRAITSMPEHQAEQQALEDALSSLRVLKAKELDSSDRPER